jgi:hypothetical protein
VFLFQEELDQGVGLVVVFKFVLLVDALKQLLCPNVSFLDRQNLLKASKESLYFLVGS